MINLKWGQVWETEDGKHRRTITGVSPCQPDLGKDMIEYTCKGQREKSVYRSSFVGWIRTTEATVIKQLPSPGLM